MRLDIPSYLVFLLISQTSCSTVLADDECSYCPNTTTYNFTNTSYYSNLSLLLHTLSNASKEHNFYNFSIGPSDNNSNSERIYGLFMCEAYILHEKCQDFVTRAVKEIMHRCPGRKTAVVWLDNCLLRYSNQSIFPDPDYRSIINKPNKPFVHCNTNEITIDEQSRFKKKLAEIMDDLANRAASDRSMDKKFATREANVSGNITIYALAQCIPDMSSSACLNCLVIAIKVLHKCCDKYRGARFQFPSCFMRHEVYPFYNKNNVPAPSKNQDDLSGILTAESLQYDFTTIEAATIFFSEENKIGVGGFGDVYKGELVSGQEVAVKRLSRMSSQGIEEFKNEVVLVAKLQHRNLVKLLGFCVQGEEKILIYEFVPNKSLDYFLFDTKKQVTLNWSMRDKIIRGIVRGLVYLHEDSRPRIIHRDLKASNILLDKDMNPKISDFGMARIIGVDQTEGSTKIIVGTYGYMSPEYAMYGQFSVKSDVFSFGVLLLEIISGKRNRSFYQEDKFDDLIIHAWNVWKDGRAMELVDPTLISDSNSMSKIMRCVHIGLLCVQNDLNKRPTTALISHILSTDSIILPEPDRPASFKDYTRTGNMDQLTSNSISSQVYPR
ncbi:unnamed protein product [Withania somnifera]